MRKLKKNADDTFRLKGYAGANGVLLAYDVAKSKRRGLLGFAIEEKEEGKAARFLLNSLTFPGVSHTLPKWNATPSNLAPIQKFRWADYSIEPGVTCRYTVHPVYGTWEHPELADPLAVELTTDDGQPERHRVAFNRAVAASQAFGRKFEEVDKLLTEHKRLPIEDWPDAARRWLENGLLTRILRFIARAKDEGWALDVAIYEYELKAIVDAVLEAQEKGADVRVLYHSKEGDEQTEANETSLRNIPQARKRARVTTRIFHDKFIVLSRLDGTGARAPVAVLCGSTNFTENGVYRQANVVHETTDEAIAGRYLALFEEIWKAPTNVAGTKRWIDQNNPMDPSAAMFVGFSPRSKGRDLVEFVNVIGKADRDILFATAFALPDSILDALLGRAHDDVVRYGIQNTASRITGFHADRTAEFTTTALLSKGLEGWVKEGLRGQRGNLLVHTKAIVVNFTGDAPIVISGSHNLSTAASVGNDENYLVIRGDTDLADRYGLEVMRFYEHYRFRYYAKLLKLGQARPLTKDDSWADDYYTAGHLKEAARLRFAGR